jgi:hypothetical protein
VFWNGVVLIPSLNVYGMILVNLTSLLNDFSVECELFNKVCNPLMQQFPFTMQLELHNSLSFTTP